MLKALTVLLFLTACTPTQAGPEPIRHDFTQELEMTRYLNAILEQELKEANQYIRHLEEDVEKCHRERT
jgi:hypothetical protein